MTNTIREQIILAILARVAEIRLTAGYNVDCGATVLRAVGLVDPDSLPLVTIWPGVEETTKEYGKIWAQMPVKIETIAAYGSSDYSVIAEGMLGDIIENIQGTEWTLPYTTGSTEIEVGDTITGATSSATAYVCGVTLDSGTWDGNDAAGDLTLRRLSGTFGAENLKVSGGVVAATTGTITASSSIANSTGGLAESIGYISGGVENYPDEDDISIGVAVTFNIKYKISTGNPYTQ